MIAFCSIATVDYLPQARVLGFALKRHHPEARLFLLLIDEQSSAVEGDPFEIIKLSDLPDSPARPRLRDQCFYYDSLELCCALRGPLHRYMYERGDIDRWLYLDVDTFVFGRLDFVFELLSKNPIVLTPHATRPLPEGEVFPIEADIARHGTYNGGVIGISRTDEAKRFIDWFCSRLSVAAFNDYRGLYVDQVWLNLVPTFFPSVCFCTHPGVNLAYWNSHERHLTGSDASGFKANGQPVLLAHFSGWSLDRPEVLSVYARANQLQDRGSWRALAATYAGEFTNRGWPQKTPIVFGGFRTFSNGGRINPEARHSYFERLREDPQLDVDPFNEPTMFRPPKAVRFKRRLRSAVSRLVGPGRPTSLKLS